MVRLRILIPSIEVRILAGHPELPQHPIDCSRSRTPASLAVAGMLRCRGGAWFDRQCRRPLALLPAASEPPPDQILSSILSVDGDSRQSPAVSINTLRHDAHLARGQESLQLVPCAKPKRVVAPTRIATSPAVLAPWRSFQFRRIDVGKANPLLATADAVPVMHCRGSADQGDGGCDRAHSQAIPSLSRSSPGR